MKEIFVFSLDNKYIAYVDADKNKIYYSLPLGGISPEWWINCITHEHIHSSSIEDGTLKIPEWMIDEILEYTGIPRMDGEWISIKN